MLDCDNNIVILWRFYVSSDRKTITQVDFEISYRPSTLSRFIKLADVVSNYPQLCFLKVQTTIGHNKIKIHRTAWVWFPLETQIFPLCHSRDTLMISHLSHYHFPLMTVVFMSVWKNAINFFLHFFNMMRKINALYLCNNKYWSQCFF